jgi:hypothetical protein
LTSLSSPKDIAKIEPLFFVRLSPHPSKVPPVPIRFGVSLDEFSDKTGKSGAELEELLKQASHLDRYLLAVSLLSHNGKHKQTIVVSFLSHASPDDHARAYYHAVLLGRKLKESNIVNNNDNDTISTEAIVKEQLHQTWDSFVLACETAGWDLSKTELQTQGYELELIS